MGLLLFEDRTDSVPAVLPHHMRPFLGHPYDPSPLLPYSSNSAATSCAPEPPQHVPTVSAAPDKPTSAVKVFSNPPRKRSHDEFTTSTAGCENDMEHAIAPPYEGPVGQPMYGEVMTLFDRPSGLPVTAESQLGPCFKDPMEEDTTTTPLPVSTDQADDVSLHNRARKSQRLDATAARFDDITAATIQRKLNHQSSLTNDGDTPPLSSGSPSTSLASSTPGEPRIDDLTLLLGISWQRVSSDDQDVDMAPAIRGWEKYIGKHFAAHLHAPRIVLKHRGLNAYLVTSSTPSATDFWDGYDATMMMSVDNSPNRFYLFSEDLSEARLVANDWETCVQRLRTTPISFEESSEPIKANSTTGAAATTTTAITPFKDVQDGRPGQEGTGAFGAGMCADGYGIGGPELGPEATMDLDM